MSDTRTTRLADIFKEFPAEGKQTLAHQASMGGKSVPCLGNPIFVGELETERGPLEMFACPECLRVFLFADFDFNPETGDRIEE